jgi:peptidoglycan/LPS O-acetylase OafA/YrhL
MSHATTIEEALCGGDNFLLLRFLAASLVIYGHGPAIAGGHAPTDVFVTLGWGEYSGSIAVDVFFVVSGFLVTRSFDIRRKALDFLRARALRILPAYLACLFVSAFVIGPVFSAHALSAYLTDIDPYRYVWRNTLLSPDMMWNIADVFRNNPRQTTINGSLWTLPAEVRMYAWVAIVGCTGLLRRRWMFNAFLVGVFALGFHRPSLLPLVPLDRYVRLAALFGAGAFCYVNRRWIPVRGGWLIVAAGTAWLCRATAIYPLVFATGEILFCFWFAYGTQRRGFNRFGDYSYGIYLWGFPVQQMWAAVVPGMSSLANSLAAFPIALSFAVASWHLIEQPALRLKPPAPKPPNNRPTGDLMGRRSAYETPNSTRPLAAAAGGSSQD